MVPMTALLSSRRFLNNGSKITVNRLFQLTNKKVKSLDKQQVPPFVFPAQSLFFPAVQRSQAAV
jgi:hypothetical protein